MSNLTPVEAIKREIEALRSLSDSDKTYLYPYLTALELALADAEFDANNDSAIKYKAVLDARNKLYEALQR